MNKTIIFINNKYCECLGPGLVSVSKDWTEVVAKGSLALVSLAIVPLQIADRGAVRIF